MPRPKTESQAATRQVELFVSRWRQRFFADAAEAAIRFEVSFDELLDHLQTALERRTHLPACAVANFDDLVHVTACRLNRPGAWHELHERFERLLIRCCRTHLLNVNPVVHVRRMLTRMRDESDGEVPPLAEYTGATPLRDWLIARFVDDMTDRHGAVRSGGDFTPAAGMVWGDPGTRAPESTGSA